MIGALTPGFGVAMSLETVRTDGSPGHVCGGGRHGATRGMPGPGARTCGAGEATDPSGCLPGTVRAPLGCGPELARGLHGMGNRRQPGRTPRGGLALVDPGTEDTCMVGESHVVFGDRC